MEPHAEQTTRTDSESAIRKRDLKGLKLIIWTCLLASASLAAFSIYNFKSGWLHSAYKKATTSPATEDRWQYEFPHAPRDGVAQTPTAPQTVATNLPAIVPTLISPTNTVYLTNEVWVTRMREHTNTVNRTNMVQQTNVFNLTNRFTETNYASSILSNMQVELTQAQRQSTQYQTLSTNLQTTLKGIQDRLLPLTDSNISLVRSNMHLRTSLATLVGSIEAEQKIKEERKQAQAAEHAAVDRLFSDTGYQVVFPIGDARVDEKNKTLVGYRTLEFHNAGGRSLARNLQ